eukprot:TRINITY_DN4531_c1_g1_i2.p1 TRINITY_DN4531_c1_g1~~TRINITY_DN4531_c1_g1_i2.p1  ORF type:complete len:1074 (+),score=252.81 TRINITY_DN4531_c1_g1_i2:348-3569(+)
MDYVERMLEGVHSVLGVNAATLSGAIDVVVVPQPDGSLRSTPFHVRFGKLQLLSSSEKLVTIYVNDVRANFYMKLGSAGEAFFVEETDEETVPPSLLTSPIGSPPPLLSPPATPTAAQQDAAGPPELDHLTSRLEQLLSKTAAVGVSVTSSTTEPQLTTNNEPAINEPANIDPASMDPANIEPVDQPPVVPTTIDDGAASAGQQQKAVTPADCEPLEPGTPGLPNNAVGLTTPAAAAAAGASAFSWRWGSPRLSSSTSSLLSVAPASTNLASSNSTVPLGTPDAARAAELLDGNGGSSSELDAVSLDKAVAAGRPATASAQRGSSWSGSLGKVGSLFRIFKGPSASSTTPPPPASADDAFTMLDLSCMAAPTDSAAGVLSAAGLAANDDDDDDDDELPQQLNGASGTEQAAQASSDNNPQWPAEQPPQTVDDTGLRQDFALLAYPPSPLLLSAELDASAVVRLHISSSSPSADAMPGVPTASVPVQQLLPAPAADASSLEEHASAASAPRPSPVSTPVATARTWVIAGDVADGDDEPNGSHGPIATSSAALLPVLAAVDACAQLPPLDIEMLETEAVQLLLLDEQPLSTTLTQQAVPPDSDVESAASMPRHDFAQASTLPSGELDVVRHAQATLDSEVPQPVNSPSTEVPSKWLRPESAEPLMSFAAARLEFSICGHLLPAELLELRPLPPKAWEVFSSQRVGFAALSRQPDLVFHPQALFRIEDRLLPWSVVGPMLVAQVAFGKSLEPAVVAPLETNWLTRLRGADKKAGRRWWGGWFGRTAPAVSSGVTDKPLSSEPTETLSLPSSPVLPSASVSARSVQRAQHQRKSLRPSSEQLRSLNLRDGPNSVRFQVSSSLQGLREVRATIYVWSPDTQIVISDIDGTITRSDVLGQIMPVLGRDWSHAGIAELYSNVTANGYHVLYLTSRAIGQADLTRGYIASLNQSNQRLPEGPVFMSPNRLLTAFNREVIQRRPEEFKIACLSDILSLFPKGSKPFYAGFGNRVTDAVSYSKVGVPPGKIFIVSYDGSIALLQSSYRQTFNTLNELCESMFPPVNKHEEEFNSWNFWKGLRG